MLAITQSTTTIIVQAGKFATSGKNTEITIGPRYKPEATLPGGLSIQQGSSVYNLRDVTFVTYYIDTSKNQLMASFLDGSIDNDDYDDQSRHAIIVANNIEDLQVAYYLNGVHYSGSAAADGYPELTAKQEISEADLSSDWIRGIKLSLVSISPIRSEAAGEGAPIKVMDHTIVGPADGHSRRILTENISLRNF